MRLEAGTFSEELGQTIYGWQVLDMDTCIPMDDVVWVDNETMLYYTLTRDEGGFFTFNPVTGRPHGKLVQARCIHVYADAKVIKIRYDSIRTHF